MSWPATSAKVGGEKMPLRKKGKRKSRDHAAVESNTISGPQKTSSINRYKEGPVGGKRKQGTSG